MRDGIPEVGDVLGDKYFVEREVGRGGMGLVFAVTNLLTEKRLALKYLSPPHAADAASVERFIREARAAGRIQHRHVIDVFDVGYASGTPFLVMPLLDGESLADLLHRDTLTLRQILLVIVRAMTGVRAAHAFGIVHRDLKPSNIFVCPGPDGQLDDPRVLDFGISKAMDEMNSTLTHSGTIVGTPHYMAIEQLTGRRDVDHRADVFSMGVILYESIAGRPPHQAANAVALALERMHVTPVHLAALRPDLPLPLAESVMRALACDRGERHQTMGDFIATLSPYADAGEPFEAAGQKVRGERASPSAPGHTTSPITPHKAFEIEAASARRTTGRTLVSAWRGRRGAFGALVITAATVGLLYARRVGVENHAQVPRSSAALPTPISNEPTVSTGPVRADLSPSPESPDPTPAAAESDASGARPRRASLRKRSLVPAPEASRSRSEPLAMDPVAPDAASANRPRRAPNELDPDQF